MPRNADLRSAAQLLGSRGGSVSSPRKTIAARENASKPRRFRLVGDHLERWNGYRWLTLEEPYDRAAREALRRLRG